MLPKPTPGSVALGTSVPAVLSELKCPALGAARMRASISAWFVPFFLPFLSHFPAAAVARILPAAPIADSGDGGAVVLLPTMVCTDMRAPGSRLKVGAASSALSESAECKAGTEPARECRWIGGSVGGGVVTRGGGGDDPRAGDGPPTVCRRGDGPRRGCVGAERAPGGGERLTGNVWEWRLGVSRPPAYESWSRRAAAAARASRWGPR